MSLVPDVVRYQQQRAFEIAEVSQRHRERFFEALQAGVGHTVELAGSARYVAGATTVIAAATREIAVDVSRMAAVVDSALPAIVAHLALVAERLGDVEEMLARPAETQAAEFYRNGTYALASGWWEEAVVDLSEAVRCYRYNPRTWFNLGVAQYRNNAPVAAAEAFARCARYAVTLEPALAARAVLLAAAVYRAAAQFDASGEILRDYCDKIDNCAELHLALGVHHHDHDHLVRALTLDPGLAVDARIGNATGLDEAAEVVCRLDDGPMHRLRTIEQMTAQLADRARSAGIDGVQPVAARLNLPPIGVDALLLAHAAHSAAVNRVTGLIKELAQVLQQPAKADSMAGDIVTARTEALEAAQAVTQREQTVAAFLASITRIGPATELAWSQWWHGTWRRHWNSHGMRAWTQSWNHARRVFGQQHPAGDSASTDDKARTLLAAFHDAWQEAWEQTWTAWERTWTQIWMQAGSQYFSYDSLVVRLAVEQVWAEARDLTDPSRDHTWRQVWEQAGSRAADQAWRQGSVQIWQHKHGSTGTVNDLQADDYVIALQRDLRARLVEPARQRAQHAQGKVDAISSREREAERLAAVADDLAAAQVSLLTIATAPACIVPFDLPGEWNDSSTPDELH